MVGADAPAGALAYTQTLNRASAHIHTSASAYMRKRGRAMIGNVLKPDGTVHIEQQVGNMRYDLTTGQVETVVPAAGATNLVFGADGR